MRQLFKQLTVFGFIVLFVLTANGVKAQQVDSSMREMVRKADSIFEVNTDSLKNAAYNKRKGNLKQSDTAIGGLIEKLEEMTLMVNQVGATIKRGFDTASVSESLIEVERLLTLLRENLSDINIQMNQRSLNASKVILQQLEKELNDWQTDLYKYSHKLTDLNNQVNKISNDTIFFNVPQDTTLKVLYIKNLLELGKKWVAISVNYNQYIRSMGILQNRVGAAYIDANDMIEDIGFRMKQGRTTAWGKEMPFLWDAKKVGDKSFAKILRGAFKSNFRLLQFFIDRNWKGLLTLLFFSVILCWWLWYNLSKIRKMNRSDLLQPLRYIHKNTVAAAALFFFAIAPFSENSPPTVFVEFFVFAMLITATWIIRAEWTPAFKTYWFVFIMLFILFGYDNLLFANSAGERWFVAVLSVAAIYIGFCLLREVKKNKNQYPVFMDEGLMLFIVANGISLLFNLFGRFTISKMVGNSAMIVLAESVALHVMVEIMFEGLYVQMEGDNQSRLSGFLQFSSLKNQLRNVVVLIAVFFWVMIFVWSLNLSADLIDLVNGVLVKQHKLGNIEFTLGSILTFAFILWLAFFIAKILSFLFGNTGEQFQAGKKNKMGSWVLLIRICIIGIGFLIAMGAAGIPIDKLTIVIGALGVGIGLGLQNIVNNLVSGIILAFEKPVEVGDVIEVGTRMGTVKEIGIRSSKIITYDGSDIIIPNADFISKEVINWTHSDTKRRIELMIGVAYGTDIEKAKGIITEILNTQKDIFKYPEPVILMHEFGNSAVTIRLLFWCEFANAIAIKSIIIEKIHKRFIEDGINIPFPQSDLHIRSVDSEIIEKLKGLSDNQHTS